MIHTTIEESQMHCSNKQKPDSKAAYFLIPFIWFSGRGKTIGTEKRSGVSRIKSKGDWVGTKE